MDEVPIFFYLESSDGKNRKPLDGPASDPPNGIKHSYEFGLKQVTPIGHSSASDPNHNYKFHLHSCRQ